MHDDKLMDGLLEKSLAAPPPEISRDFDARVLRAVRPQRLTSLGRVAMGTYAVLAVGVTVWFARDLGPVPILAAIGITAAVAAGASAYVRQLATSNS